MTLSVITAGGGQVLGAGANYLDLLLADHPNVLRIGWKPDTGLSRLDSSRPGQSVKRSIQTIVDIVNFSSTTIVVCHDPDLVLEVSRLLRSFRRPVGLLIWDDFRYLLRKRHHGPSARKRYTEAFHRVVQHSAFALTMTEPAAQALTNLNLRIRTVVAPPAAASALWDLGESRPAVSKTGPDLAFIGSGYAWRDINRFTKALESIRPPDDRKLIVFGELSVRCIRRRRLEVAGRMPDEELFRATEQLSAGFLPYGQSGMLKAFTQFAFPSKLASYVALKMPTIYVGAPEAPAAAYIKAHSLGLVLSDCNDKELSDAFEMLESPEFIRRFAEGRACARQELGPTALQTSLIEVLPREPDEKSVQE